MIAVERALWCLAHVPVLRLGSILALSGDVAPNPSQVLVVYFRHVIGAERTHLAPGVEPGAYRAFSVDLPV